MTHDRGSFDEISLQRCERGFLIQCRPMHSGYKTPLYAFDRIEDAAKWLVEQYRETPPLVVEPGTIVVPG